MCYTLQVGRKHFEYRKSLVFTDLNSILGQLDNYKGEATDPSRDGSPIVFMFPGQGIQQIDLGKDLYLHILSFREDMDRGFQILPKLTGTDFKNIFYSTEQSGVDINSTCYTQPLIFLYEYSFARLATSMGLIPKQMIGHSLGEYVAACLSGVFNFEDALYLVAKRGELMDKLPGGMKISVNLSDAQVHEYLSNRISLASINGPSQTVLSGDKESMNKLTSYLETAGIDYFELPTSHAFH